MQKDPEKKTEETFVSRWSRRKTEVADRAETTDLNTISDSASSGELVASIDSEPEQPEEKALTDKDMPSIDSLNKDSDYSMFMSQGVSEGLRRLALRKLFRGAQFNIRDGLDDYDDDFRNFAALGDIITCDMKHQMEMEEERKRKEEELRAAEAELTENKEEKSEDPDGGTTEDDENGDAETGVEADPETNIAKDNKENDDSENNNER